jgi:phosphatidylglycerol:prolipoprotein diacylglycerol transferase
VSAIRQRIDQCDERLDTLADTVPIAVIAFDFDPLFRLAETIVVRWQTIALAIIIAAALIVAGVIARRASLRPDDLLFITVGIVPGAVIGGRLGYVLLHLDYYAANPGAILDPASGGLELGLAVVGGLLTASYVARLLDAPIGPWSQVVVMPLLFALGAGKLTMVLGGAGQGQPSSLAWATAYLGPGPWSSLAPALPSHPSQAYEGFGTLAVLLVFTLVLAGAGLGSRLADGRGLAIGLGAWALVRVLASLTWRDPAVLGPLNVGTVIALALTVGCVAAALIITARPRDKDTEQRDTGHEDAETTRLEPVPVGPGADWSDPDKRPRS